MWNSRHSAKMNCSKCIADMSALHIYFLCTFNINKCELNYWRFIADLSFLKKLNKLLSNMEIYILKQNFQITLSVFVSASSKDKSSFDTEQNTVDSSESWKIYCFSTNWLSKLFNDSVLNALIFCYSKNQRFEQISWVNGSRLTTVTCCHLLV